MEKKEDRRVQMTKRMLKEALIELLSEKDIYHISIRELCEAADINRTTFYKYYGSQFDLLTDMENDIASFISEAIVHQTSNYDKILSICSYLEENIDFVRLIINNNVDLSFAQKIFSMEVIKENTLKHFMGKRNQAELEYMYHFMTYGAFRMVCVWLNKENREPVPAFAKLLAQMIAFI